MFRKFLIASGTIAISTSVAFAHITLETGEAKVGTNYKAVLRVPHGCNGAPTTAIRVQIPEGVIAVKPMPKPGWRLETVSGAYARTYDYYGTPTAQGVKEVVWSGGRLLDEHYDEFAFRAALTDSLQAGQTIHFPVIQECDGAASRWTDTTGGGHSHDHGAGAAPSIKLVPKP